MKTARLILATLAAGLLLTATASAQTPVAYYSLNGNVNDTSGNGYNGTVIGNESYATGLFGQQAFSFDGNTEIATTTTDNLGIYNGSFTVDAEVNLSVLTTDDNASVALFGTLGSGQDYGLQMLIRNDAPFFGFYADDTGSPANSIAANTWYNLAFAYDASAKTQTLYINGTEVAQGTVSNNFLGSGQTAYIGGSGFGGEPTGLMQDLSVYNTALNQQQIQALQPQGAVTWTNAGANSTWDATTTNWINTGSSTPNTYTDGDIVTFDDTPGVNQTITIPAGGVNPYSVTFNNSLSYAFSGGPIGGFNNIVTLNGTGTVSLNSANTYGGGTVVNAGVLNANDDSALGTGSLRVNGGTVNFTTANPSIGGLAGTGTVSLASGTTLTVAGGSGIYSGSISGTASSVLAVSSGASLTLANGANTYGGGTTINGNLTAVSGSTGSLPLGTGIAYVGPSGVLNISGGVEGLAGSYYVEPNGTTVSGYFTSLPALNAHVQNNPSLPVFATDNTYTTNGTGGGPGGTNPTFNYNQNGEGSQFPTSLSAANGGYNYFDGVYRGNIYIATAGWYSFGTDSDDGSSVYIDGNTIVSNLNYQPWDGDSGPQVWNSDYLTAGLHSIVVGFFQGGGGYGLSVWFGAGQNEPTQILPNSILSTGQGVTTVAGLTGSGTVNLSSTVLQVGLVNGVSSSSNFAGSFTSDTVSSITLLGTGTFTLSGTSGSSFTAPITVSNGTLQVTGNSGSAPIIVGDLTSGNAATLTGTGTIGGPVTVNGPPAGGGFGGTVAAASSSTLSLSGGLTLQAGSISSFALGSPNGSTNPLIATSGPTNSLTVTGASTISFTTPQAGTYDLFSYTGSTSFNNFALSPTSISNYPAYSYALLNAAGQVDLLVTAPSIFWTGVNGGPTPPWDTSTMNWSTAAGVPTTYSDPNGVVTFGDTYFNGSSNVAVASGNVVIRSAGVSPSLVTFDNSTVDYVVSNLSGSVGISGAATIVLSGTGTVTLMSPNTFTGLVSIGSGQLNVQASSALGSSGGVTVSPGAALQLQGGVSIGNIPLSIGGTGLASNPNGALQSVSGANSYGGLIQGGGTITSSSASGTDGLTLTGGLNPLGGALTINGPGNTTVSTNGIVGSGTVTYSGTGTLTLSAANSFSGLTTISSGTLSVPSSGSLAGSLEYDTGATSTIAGTLGGGASALNVTNGTLVLNGANTYGGGTSLSGGTIRVGNGGALGTATVALNGGTLQDNGTAVTLANSFSIGANANFSSAGSGSLILDGTGLSTPATVTLTSNATIDVANTTTINDVIDDGGNGFGITIAGSGTLIFGAANTFTGGTTINSAVLQLNNAGALQNSVVTLNAPGGLTFGTTVNGSVSLGGLQDGSSGPVNLTIADLASNSLALTLGNSNSVGSGDASYSGNLTAASLTKVGANSQTLTGNNTLGSVTVSAGTLRIGPVSAGVAPLGAGPVTLLGGILALQGQSGSGTVVYANNVTVASSSAIDVSGSLAATMGDLSIGSTLNVTSSDGSGNPYSLTFSGASGVTTLTGNATFNLNNSSGGGAATLTLGSLDDQNTPTPFSIAFNGGTVNLNSAAKSLVPGTVVSIVNSATLNSNSATAIGAAAQLSVGAGSTFNLGASQQVSTLNGSGSVTLGSNTLTVGSGIADSSTSTFAGSINGAGGLTLSKAAGGSLVLQGASTYAGPTIINGGVLRLQGTGIPVLPSVSSSALQFQLDASNSGSLILSGGNVTQWNDASGNGVSFVGTTGTDAAGSSITPPTYLASGINGLGTVNLNGSTNVLNGTSSTSQQTVFVVEQVNGYTQWGTPFGEVSPNDHSIRLDPNAAAWANPGNGNDFTNGGTMYINGAPQSGDGTYTQGVPQIIEGVASGVNNWVAALGDSYPGRFFDGEIGEVLVYNGILSSADQTAIDNYLTEKWLTPISPTSNLLPTTTAVSLTTSSATLDLGVNDQAIASLTGVAGSNVMLESQTLTVGDNTNTVFSGVLSGAGGSLVKTGSGMLTLAGVNIYTGATTVSAGTLRINSGASIASTSVSVAAGATLQLAGSTAALPSAANITTQGTGSASDGALVLTGAATQTVGVISGQALTSSPTTYSGNTTVGDGTTAANLTATQILQNTLTINAGSTVTIAPSGPGMDAEAQGSGAVSGAALAAGSSGTALAAGSSDSGGDSSTDPFTAIQAAIASGSISSITGTQLENRIAAIERLAATDPGLDVSLLEDRVLAALPSSVSLSTDSSALVDPGSSLLAVDSDTSDSASGNAVAAFAPSTASGGSPAAVPEPSTLLLAALGGIALALAARRRTICRE